jgi:hypothetical protein
MGQGEGAFFYSLKTIEKKGVFGVKIKVPLKT